MRRVEDSDRAEIVGLTPDMSAEEAIGVIADQVGARVLLPDWDNPDSDDGTVVNEED